MCFHIPAERQTGRRDFFWSSWGIEQGRVRSPQVPPEVYDLFSAAGKKGAEAEKEWDATWASYKEKYPEVSHCLC